MHRKSTSHTHHENQMEFPNLGLSSPFHTFCPLPRLFYFYFYFFNDEARRKNLLKERGGERNVSSELMDPTSSHTLFFVPLNSWESPVRFLSEAPSPIHPNDAHCPQVFLSPLYIPSFLLSLLLILSYQVWYNLPFVFILEYKRCQHVCSHTCPG